LRYGWCMMVLFVLHCEPSQPLHAYKARWRYRDVGGDPQWLVAYSTLHELLHEGAYAIGRKTEKTGLADVRQRTFKVGDHSSMRWSGSGCCCVPFATQDCWCRACGVRIPAIACVSCRSIHGSHHLWLLRHRPRCSVCWPHGTRWPLKCTGIEVSARDCLWVDCIWCRKGGDRWSRDST
jgi:hypothetical protein